MFNHVLEAKVVMRNNQWDEMRTVLSLLITQELCQHKPVLLEEEGNNSIS